MTGELAFGKEKIEWDQFENRKYDILFSGTYTAPARLEKAIKEMPDSIVESVYELIEMLKADNSLTIEEAVDTLSETEIYDYINLDKPLHTQTFYLADAYVRCLNRKKLVEALDRCEHELHLFGALWEELPLKHATIHRELPFNLTFTVFTKAKISVNIMPNFKAGSHDRVFSSQLNGAVSLTDPTILLQKEYKNKENILFFDLNNIAESTSIVDESLRDLDKLKKIAQAGYEVASKKHTWTEIAKKLLSAL